MKYLGYRLTVFMFLLTLAAGTLMGPTVSYAAEGSGVDSDAATALAKLYSGSDKARELGELAKGVLVFPSMYKGGFMAGGQYGEGVLIVDGKQVGRYNSIQMSFGMQAGLQKYGYALFFMTQESLAYLQNSKGWELGVGPSIVVVDEGVGKNLSTTTLRSEIYAFFFDPKGLMAGMGLQGTKITKTE
jgi:lipid-binding SYLF domain-containing protein